MNFIKLSDDGSVSETLTLQDMHNRFPGSNFVTDENLPEGYHRVLFRPLQTSPDPLKGYELGSVEFDSLVGQYYQTWYPVDLPEDVITNRINSLKNAVRFERNVKLKACDYLVSSDLWATYSETNKQKITEYRQALRDITSQSNFPLEVVWPQLPDLT